VTIDPVCESPPQEWLSVSAVSSGPGLVLAVAGEADWVTADHLRDQLTQALACGPRSVILDLTGLEFCNLRGLGALHDFCDVAEQASVDVTFRGMPRQLTWLIDTIQTCVLAGERRDHGWAPRPLLRPVPASTSVGSPCDSRAAD
jgi:anti-anti-sigma factor